ncbi:beta-N-acetylhexosaminidase, partial [Flavobacterium circumlabens]
LAVLSSGYSQKTYTEKDIQIIPKPTQLVVKEGVFKFSKETKFVVSGDFQKEASSALIQKFETAAGWKPEIATAIQANNFVQFKVDPALKNEAYILDVNSKSITITAKGNAG